MYVDIMYTPLQRNRESCSQPRIDWEKAKKTGLIADYQKEVEKCLAPLLNNSHSHAEDMDRELKYVARLLKDSAERTLPLIQSQRSQKYKDSNLTALCAQSRAARRAWREANSPTEGPLYDEKCRLRRAVKRRVRYCAAQAENRKIMQRGRMFSEMNYSNRFRLPGRKKRNCMKLVENGTTITAPTSLLEVKSF